MHVTSEESGGPRRARILLGGRALAVSAPPEVVGVVVAAALSGLPSTVHALVTGRDPLAAARAAGTLLPGRRHRPGLVAGAVVHLAVSTVWGGAIAVAVRPLARRSAPLAVLAGAVAGAAVAAVDLGVVARWRYPHIAVLPSAPQVADHVAFGALVAAGAASAHRARLTVQ